MNLPTEIFGNVIVVHTPEELGGDQTDAFRAYVPGLDRRQVVLDLDGTEMIDSQGLCALLEVQDKVRGVGGDVKIASANANNRKILEITRLDQQLEVYENVLDAVRSFR
jgi:anti-sigma B factor antagonist